VAWHTAVERLTASVRAVGMARVVVVHGVGQQYLGRWSLQDGVARAVVDGVEHAGAEGRLSLDQVDVAFYGNLFRPAGRRGDGEPVQASDLCENFEAGLLYAWWAGAADAEPDRVASPAASGMRVPVPVTVQRALDALLRSRCVSTATAEAFLVGALRQVSLYLTCDRLRAAAMHAVAARVGPDTRVLIGHSLGSVVAYESLCANPSWPVRTLVTLGSPLGTPKLIFDRLRPAPVGGKGAWPAGITGWRNLCDRYDVVAAVKRLGPLFDCGTRSVADEIVDNGWKVHELGRHLTARETGRAVLTGLTGA